MEKMKFLWEKGEKVGSFNVTSFSVEECIEIAEDAILKDGAVMVEWYSVE